MSFEMKVNLKGTYPGGQPPKKLISGIYKGKIGKVEGREVLGVARGMFVIEVIEHDRMSGLTAVTSMRIPTSSEDKVIYYWRALAESCGYTREEIEAIETWNDKHFLNRECYFEYTAAKNEAHSYPGVKWLIPSMVETAKKRFQSKLPKT